MATVALLRLPCVALLLTAAAPGGGRAERLLGHRGGHGSPPPPRSADGALLQLGGAGGASAHRAARAAVAAGTAPSRPRPPALAVRRRAVATALLGALFSGSVRGDADDHVPSQVLELLDKNGDGLISAKEFTRAAHETIAGPDGRTSDPELEWWFQQLFARSDVDGSGALDEEEAEYMVELARDAFRIVADSQDVDLSLEKTLDAAYEAEAAEVFRELDTNADGKLEEAEMLAACEATAGRQLGAQERQDLSAMFHRSDVDGDGTLDPDEVMIMRYLAHDAVEYQSPDEAFVGSNTESAGSAQQWQHWGGERLWGVHGGKHRRADSLDGDF